MGKFGGDYRGGVGKSGVLEHKSGNISETRKDRGRDTMDYGGPIFTKALLNRTLPSVFYVGRGGRFASSGALRQL